MKKLTGNTTVSGILIAIVGLVLLLMPSLTNRIIVIGLAVALLLYGIYRIIRYATTRDAAAAMNGHDLAIGLICAVIGLLMLLYSSVVISILPFLFGLLLLYGAARSIQTAFDVRRFHGLYWALHLIIGIVFVIAGIAVIRDPFGTAQVLTRFVGICLLVLGIYQFVSNRKVSQLRTEYRSENDVIDQEEVLRNTDDTNTTN